MLNDVQAAEGGAEIDTTQNHLRHIRIADAGSLEDHRALLPEVSTEKGPGLDTREKGKHLT